MNDLRTSRTYLSMLLAKLADSPELLLHADGSASLEEAITTYQDAYDEALEHIHLDEEQPSLTHTSLPLLEHDIEELHVPDSVITIDMPDLASEAEKKEEPDPEHDVSYHSQDKPEHGASDVTSIKSEGQSPEKGPALTPGTLVLVNEIPELFDVLEQGLEGRHIIEQIERLKAWSLKESYLLLDVPRQRELAHYLVARLRSVQDTLKHHDAQTHKSRFKEIATGIMVLFKERGQDIGFIHGLARGHGPQHGTSWDADATHWREALLVHITPPDYEASTHASKSSPKSSTSHAPSPLHEELKPYVSLLQGKRVLCVGGVKKPHQLQNLKAWFPETTFTWVESEKKKGLRLVQSEAIRIKEGRYDTVWIFLRALSHAESNLLIDACKQSEHLVHRVCIEKGFGSGDLLDGFTRASPPWNQDTSR